MKRLFLRLFSAGGLLFLSFTAHAQIATTTDFVVNAVYDSERLVAGENHILNSPTGHKLYYSVRTNRDGSKVIVDRKVLKPDGMIVSLDSPMDPGSTSDNACNSGETLVCKTNHGEGISECWCEPINSGGGSGGGIRTGLKIKNATD